jgi:ribonuclease D
MDKQIKEFFTNEQMCKIIDINDLYKNKTKKQAPDLNKICLELFGKGIDKIERISNWKLRPLRKSQMKYCCLDAFILKFIYNKLI